MASHHPRGSRHYGSSHISERGSALNHRVSEQRPTGVPVSQNFHNTGRLVPHWYTQQQFQYPLWNAPYQVVQYDHHYNHQDFTADSAPNQALFHSAPPPGPNVRGVSSFTSDSGQYQMSIPPSHPVPFYRRNNDNMVPRQHQASPGKKRSRGNKMKGNTSKGSMIAPQRIVSKQRQLSVIQNKQETAGGKLGPFKGVSSRSTPKRGIAVVTKVARKKKIPPKSAEEIQKEKRQIAVKDKANKIKSLLKRSKPSSSAKSTSGTTSKECLDSTQTLSSSNAALKGLRNFLGEMEFSSKDWQAIGSGGLTNSTDLVPEDDALDSDPEIIEQQPGPPAEVIAILDVQEDSSSESDDMGEEQNADDNGEKSERESSEEKDMNPEANGHVSTDACEPAIGADESDDSDISSEEDEPCISLEKPDTERCNITEGLGSVPPDSILENSDTAEIDQINEVSIAHKTTSRLGAVETECDATAGTTPDQLSSEHLGDSDNTVSSTPLYPCAAHSRVDFLSESHSVARPKGFPGRFDAGNISISHSSLPVSDCVSDTYVETPSQQGNGAAGWTCLSPSEKNKLPVHLASDVSHKEQYSRRKRRVSDSPPSPTAKDSFSNPVSKRIRSTSECSVVSEKPAAATRTRDKPLFQRLMRMGKESLRALAADPTSSRSRHMVTQLMRAHRSQLVRQLEQERFSAVSGGADEEVTHGPSSPQLPATGALEEVEQLPPEMLTDLRRLLAQESVERPQEVDSPLPPGLLAASRLRPTPLSEVNSAQRSSRSSAREQTQSPGFKQPSARSVAPRQTMVSKSPLTPNVPNRRLVMSARNSSCDSALLTLSGTISKANASCSAASSSLSTSSSVPSCSTSNRTDEVSIINGTARMSSYETNATTSSAAAVPATIQSRVRSSFAALSGSASLGASCSYGQSRSPPPVVNPHSRSSTGVDGGGPVFSGPGGVAQRPMLWRSGLICDQRGRGGRGRGGAAASRRTPWQPKDHFSQSWVNTCRIFRRNVTLIEKDVDNLTEDLVHMEPRWDTLLRLSMVETSIHNQVEEMEGQVDRLQREMRRLRQLSRHLATVRIKCMANGRDLNATDYRVPPEIQQLLATMASAPPAPRAEHHRYWELNDSPDADGNDEDPFGIHDVRSEWRAPRDLDDNRAHPVSSENSWPSSRVTGRMEEMRDGAMDTVEGMVADSSLANATPIPISSEMPGPNTAPDSAGEPPTPFQPVSVKVEQSESPARNASQEQQPLQSNSVQTAHQDTEVKSETGRISEPYAEDEREIQLTSTLLRVRNELELNEIAATFAPASENVSNLEDSVDSPSSCQVNTAGQSSAEADVNAPSDAGLQPNVEMEMGTPVSPSTAETNSSSNAYQQPNAETNAEASVSQPVHETGSGPAGVYLGQISKTSELYGSLLALTNMSGTNHVVLRPTSQEETLRRVSQTSAHSGSDDGARLNVAELAVPKLETGEPECPVVLGDSEQSSQRLSSGEAVDSLASSNHVDKAPRKVVHTSEENSVASQGRSDTKQCDGDANIRPCSIALEQLELPTKAKAIAAKCGPKTAKNKPKPKSKRCKSTDSSLSGGPEQPVGTDLDFGRVTFQRSTIDDLKDPVVAIKVHDECVYALTSRMEVAEYPIGEVGSTQSPKLKVNMCDSIQPSEGEPRRRPTSMALRMHKGNKYIVVGDSAGYVHLVRMGGSKHGRVDSFCVGAEVNCLYLKDERLYIGGNGVFAALKFISLVAIPEAPHDAGLRAAPLQTWPIGSPLLFWKRQMGDVAVIQRYEAHRNRSLLLLLLRGQALQLRSMKHGGLLRQVGYPAPSSPSLLAVCAHYAIYAARLSQEESVREAARSAGTALCAVDLQTGRRMRLMLPRNEHGCMQPVTCLAVNDHYLVLGHKDGSCRLLHSPRASDLGPQLPGLVLRTAQLLRSEGGSPLRALLVQRARAPDRHLVLAGSNSGLLQMFSRIDTHATRSCANRRHNCYICPDTSSDKQARNKSITTGSRRANPEQQSAASAGATATDDACHRNDRPVTERRGASGTATPTADASEEHDASESRAAGEREDRSGIVVPRSGERAETAATVEHEQNE